METLNPPGIQATEVQRTANLYSSGITKTIQKVQRTDNIKTAAYVLICHRCAADHAYS
jgi:hypothetical protein